MEKEKVLSLIKEIMALDEKRDELYEELALLAGDKGLDALRKVQNGYFILEE